MAALVVQMAETIFHRSAGMWGDSGQLAPRDQRYLSRLVFQMKRAAAWHDRFWIALAPIVLVTALLVGHISHSFWGWCGR